jgi:hypothetical protein
MSGAPESDGKGKSSRSRWRYWIELFVVCLLSVLAAKAVDKFASPETLAAAKRYQAAAMAEVMQITPAQTYELFMQSMGLSAPDARTDKDRFVAAERLCTIAGQLQFATTALAEPRDGTLMVDGLGKLDCAPITPTAKAQGDALDGLRDPEMFPQDDGLFSGSLLAPRACLAAFQAEDRVRSACVDSIPRAASGWGEAVLEFAGRIGLPVVRPLVMLFAPLGALADVVWHNYVGWSPAALLRLMLVGCGLGVSLLIVPRLIGTEDPVSFALVYGLLVPVGALAFATLLAWLAVFLSQHVLSGVDRLLNIDTSNWSLFGASGFSLGVLGKTVLMMFDEHLGALRARKAKL